MQSRASAKIALPNTSEKEVKISKLKSIAYLAGVGMRKEKWKFLAIATNMT